MKYGLALFVVSISTLAQAENPDFNRLLDGATQSKQEIVRFVEAYGSHSAREQTFTMEGWIRGFSTGFISAGSVSGKIEAHGMSVLHDAEIMNVNLVNVEQINEFLAAVNRSKDRANKLKLTQRTDYSIDDLFLAPWRFDDAEIVNCTGFVLENTKNLIDTKNALKVNRDAEIARLQNAVSVLKTDLLSLEGSYRQLNSDQRATFDRLYGWAHDSHLVIDEYYARNYQVGYARNSTLGIRQKDYWLEAKFENENCKNTNRTDPKILPAESFEVSLIP